MFLPETWNVRESTLRNYDKLTFASRVIIDLFEGIENLKKNETSADRVKLDLENIGKTTSKTKFSKSKQNQKRLKTFRQRTDNNEIQVFF